MKPRTLLVALAATAIGDALSPALALCAASCLFLTTSAVAQGTLTPPGPPAPTMKSLDQIEARTPIKQASLPYTISVPGSYYLTENLSVTGGDAITIAASGTTLDLNGFTISSSANPAAGTAVLINGSPRDITIINGHIVSGVTLIGGTFTGSGFASGIDTAGSNPRTVLVEKVSVSSVRANGISLGLNATCAARSCAVSGAGGNGIVAGIVTECTANGCGNMAISAETVQHCYGAAVAGSLAGIYAYNNVSNSVGSSAGSGYGVFATGNAENCNGFSGAGQGVNATNVINCYGYSESSQGILAETAINSRGESNSNRGIFTNVAMACSGRSSGGSYGLFATSVASNSYGLSATGIGLNAYIAIGCVGTNNNGPSVGYVYHYNMPP